MGVFLLHSTNFKTCVWSSPRSWGCFPPRTWYKKTENVFPTLVGVFPSLHPPRHQKGVFPTLVGVFPSIVAGHPVSSCLPHARGGVSYFYLFSSCPSPSSPRSWGCFLGRQSVQLYARVFPTLVGVFPCGGFFPGGLFRLPHARGGVSTDGIVCKCDKSSSPRSWGCFWLVKACDKTWPVFPTLVGVFPRRSPQVALLTGLPHARGGVSIRLHRRTY